MAGRGCIKPGRSCTPELQQLPCLSSTPVLQQNGACAPAPVALQGPREMAHLGPANPAAHEQVPFAVLHTPPPMQSLFLEQPWLPHSCCEAGAAPTLFTHACAEPPQAHYSARKLQRFPALGL